MPAQYPRGRSPMLAAGVGRFRSVGPGRVRPSPKFYGMFSIAGITKDSTGVALGNCVVHLFETATDIEIDQMNSDGSGNYSFTIGNNATTYYIVADKPGSPEVAGVTVNMLTAA